MSVTYVPNGQGFRTFKRRPDRSLSKNPPLHVVWLCLSCGHRATGRTLKPEDLERLRCSRCNARGEVSMYSITAAGTFTIRRANP
jgi:DNA-directed RNA polymerase subunit RPC12/RpoP